MTAVPRHIRHVFRHHEAMTLHCPYCDIRSSLHHAFTQACRHLHFSRVFIARTRSLIARAMKLFGPSSAGEKQ